jgi:UDP-glucose:(heptosyl)LPS alpha-1,3-glucosyltransferase
VSAVREERMRVALVRYKYSSHGGAERYVDLLAEGLASAGAEVRILCASWGGGSAKGLSVEKIPVPRRPSPLRLLLFASRVRAWSRRNPGFILFSFERVPGAEVFRAGDGIHAEWLLRKRVLRPWSWFLDYLRPLNLAYLYLERAMFASPALRYVIAISNWGRDGIVRRFGVPLERITVIHNGVDAARFPPDRKAAARERLRTRFGIPEGETVFLYVGSGFARKGVGTIAAAARLLSDRGRGGFRVVLVGKGNPAPYVRSAGSASGRLVFTGPVAGADDLFLGADAFVFPTVYEPFGSACIEAMAAGLPVVTTFASGASEVLSDGVSGFLLDDPLDGAALADRMEALLDPDTRHRMGAAARNAAESGPQERNVRQTVAVLASVWREKMERAGSRREGSEESRCGGPFPLR